MLEKLIVENRLLLKSTGRNQDHQKWHTYVGKYKRL